MNIYFKELKDYRLPLLFWSLGVIAYLIAAMSKYQGFSRSETSLTETIESLPAGISAVFGLASLDLQSAGGYFALSVMYLAVMLGIHAALIGSGIISKEETDKTIEFLFSKPLTRSRILFSKIIAAFTVVVALNLVTLAASVVAVAAFNEGPSINAEILFLMPCIFFIQIIFLMVGVSLAAVMRRPKRAGLLAGAVLLAAFIASVFVDLSEKYSFLKYATPFKYFDSKTVYAEDKYDITYIIITVAIVAALLVVSRFAYKKRDFYV